jgi:4-hydroxybenzoyl-CoA reductase subunit beta
MGLPEVKYLSPSNLEEACAALKEFDSQIAILAGGTDLIMHLKHRLDGPTYLLSLKNLTGLNNVHYDRDSGFVLGAMCSLRDISVNSYVKSKLTALAQAADSVASPQIRNMGTIGGNVCLDTRCWYFNRSKHWRASFSPCFKVGGKQCHVVKGGKQCYALFQADTVPSLLVMKTKLKLLNGQSERVVPLEAFYSGRGEVPNRLVPGEILTEILVPDPPTFSGAVYLKYRKRDTLDFPIIGVSSLVHLDGKGKRCEEARFAFSGVGMGPVLIEATDLLAGLDEPRLTEDHTRRLVKELKPVTHMGISASFKRRFARVLVQKAFLEAWKKAGNAGPLSQRTI